MGFCSYSREYSISSYTNIENQFINKYMAMADGDAVKVYIFGLYLCQNVQNEYSLKEAAESLKLSEEQVIDLFKFWEDFDLLEIVSMQPFSVRYFPADYAKGKPKKIRTEKYSDFNKAVQSLLPKKMISSNEFMKYFSVMEEYAIKPEAMLLIIRYCIDLKGDSIPQNYILQVAKNFAAEGVTTVEQIENKLSDYMVQSDDLTSILRSMGSNKKPEPDDYKLLKKWTDSLGFDLSVIVFTASLHKKSNLLKLDETLQELYTNKKFSEAEIRDFLARKTEIRNLTISIAKELGVYCQVIETYTDHFVGKWLAAGYEDSSLISLAKYCFRRDRKSFEKMDELIQKLISIGVISTESIISYMEAEAREQEFLSEILKEAGISRRCNQWDKECLQRWRSWNFSDEMILKAANLAQGKTNPIPYINTVLSSWKTHDIYSLSQLSNLPQRENIYSNKFASKNEELKKKVQNYYFNLREKAKDKAEYYLKLARNDPEFRQNEDAIKQAEIHLGKAEALGGDIDGEAQNLKALRNQRAKILKKLNISEEMLTPQYRCKKCNDTGFDKNGNICECYIQYVTNVSEEKRLDTILDVYSNIDM